MTPDIQIEFDKSLKKWSRALTVYLKVSKKDTAQVINKKLAFVVRRAMKLTPNASKALIEHVLGVVAYRVSISKKDGQFKARRKIVKGTRAVSIIQGKRVKSGKEPLTAKEAQKEARKMLSRRLRAIGSAKAGWIIILRKLSKAARYPMRFIKAPRIKHKGKATAANPRKKAIEAIAEYAVHIRREGKLITDPRVVQATSKAFRLEARDTGRNVAKRWADNWKKNLR